MMICPICEKSIDPEYRDTLDHLLLEESYRCGEHYYYNFVTGYYQEIICGSEFVWSYDKYLSRLDKLRRKIIIYFAKRRST